MSIAQIRLLQTQSPTQPFALELVTGRVIQIYDPHTIATCEDGHGSIGILYGDGSFEVFAAERVVSVSVGVHPQEQDRLKARMARARQIIEGQNKET